MTENLYYRVDTEHFSFDIYRAWKGTNGGAMFRAGSYIKKGGGKRYSIDYELFAEWDYQSTQDAFEHAKKCLSDYMGRLIDELKEAREQGEE